MPLNTQYALILRTLHGLNDAIVRTGDDTEARTGLVDSLMVEGVDRPPPAPPKEGGNRSLDVFRSPIYII
jgi:hypothetical protein